MKHSPYRAASKVATAVALLDARAVLRAFSDDYIQYINMYFRRIEHACDFRRGRCALMQQQC
jgi:hypothetical protein